MSEKRIDDFINELLIGDAQRNALEFVTYLRTNEMQFKKEKGYWEDKCYWGISYKGKYVCSVLINNYEKTDPESWTVWSDSSGSKWYEDSLLDEHLKETAWDNVDICGDVGECGYCGHSGGISKKIFGKDFYNVCLTVFRFNNPNASTVECIIKLLEIRKSDIINHTV